MDYEYSRELYGSNTVVIAQYWC